jgi:hypothetical protein
VNLKKLDIWIYFDLALRIINIEIQNEDCRFVKSASVFGTTLARLVVLTSFKNPEMIHKNTIRNYAIDLFMILKQWTRIAIHTCKRTTIA